MPRAALLVFLLAMILPSPGSLARSIRLYVGTNTRPGGSEGILTALFDLESGAFGQPELAARAENPTYLALSPDGRFLYAAVESSEGGVMAFRRRADGHLEELNRVASGGAGACHVALHPSGKLLFVSHYNGGSLAVFRVAEDGSLSERTALLPFSGNGPDPVRQRKPHAHGAWCDAAGKTLYCCDLGTDRIRTFRLDAGKGALDPIEPAGVTAGGGPRHLALHPSGRFAAVNHEMGMAVSLFAVDPGSGALAMRQTIPLLPPGQEHPGATSAALFFHPSGKWLYVSNRGPDTLDLFASGDEGGLAPLGSFPSGVKKPRDFRIDPGGRWLVVAGQADSRLVAHAIDPATGKLTPAPGAASLPDPTCVLFAP